MLARLCDKIESGHELLRKEMHQQERCLRKDFGDKRQGTQDMSSVRSDGATRSPYVYASTHVSSGRDRSTSRRSMPMHLSDSLPNGQVTTTTADKSVVVMPPQPCQAMYSGAKKVSKVLVSSNTMPPA